MESWTYLADAAPAAMLTQHILIPPRTAGGRRGNVHLYRLELTLEVGEVKVRRLLADVCEVCNASSSITPAYTSRANNNNNSFIHTQHAGVIINSKQQTKSTRCKWQATFYATLHKRNFPLLICNIIKVNHLQL